jgi:signal transduction histidine kinase
VEPPVRRRAEDLVDSAASTAIEGGETTTCERPAPDLDGPVLLAAGRKPRILVAEDNPEVREFIGALLADRFDVAMAEDGETAWEMVRTKVPDLVVSDVMMPNMSGTELCRVIKQDPALRAIPVILLTARVGSEATLEAYARGADDFVAKPFHPGVLIARIRAQLNLRTLAMQVAQQEKLAAVGTMSAGILHEVRNPVNAILNASRALGSGRIDEETGRQLLQVIGEAAVRIEGITSALDAHARPAEAGETVSCDLKEGIEATLRLVGHRLNGVAVNRNYETEHPARAPAGSMNQVLLNLIDNALRVEARNLWLDLRFEDGMIVTTIADDGPGISNEDADRIFDPFFTKRPQGDGTGLGLYLSRRMVEEAGGALTAGERPGGGALFTMVVPALLLDTEPGRAPWNA